MAVCRVEKTKDYKVMSNHHLRNKDLTLKAKGLLSYILSLPLEWDYTIRGLAAICKENKDTICRIINELIAEGYIIREQERGTGGQLGKISYTIYEYPQKSEESSGLSPCPKNADTVKADTVNRDTEKPYTVSSAQINTNISNKNKINTDINNYQSNQSTGTPTPIDTDRIDSQQELENYRELIHENIEYDITVLNEPKDKEYIDEIVEVMLECVMSRGYIKIGGQEIAAEVVKSRMLKICSEHIEYILYCLQRNTTKVRNIKAYLKTTIYNSPTTLNSYFRAEVNHDFGGD